MTATDFASIPDLTISDVQVSLDGKRSGTGGADVPVVGLNDWGAAPRATRMPVG